MRKKRHHDDDDDDDDDDDVDDDDDDDDFPTFPFCVSIFFAFLIYNVRSLLTIPVDSSRKSCTYWFTCEAYLLRNNTHNDKIMMMLNMLMMIIIIVIKSY